MTEQETKIVELLQSSDSENVATGFLLCEQLEKPFCTEIMFAQWHALKSDVSHMRSFIVVTGVAGQDVIRKAVKEWCDGTTGENQKFT